MMDKLQIASTLWDLASELRGADDPLLRLDVVRCLLFLRYASSGSLRLGRRREPLIIPPLSAWRHIQSCVSDLANVLANACRELEHANPELRGTLTSVDFTRVEPWDGVRRDRILKQLVDGTSRMPGLATAKDVGEAYDHLVTMLAESASKGDVGEMFLSVPLASLMVSLLDLRDGARVCDPVCRAGRTLVTCAARAEASGFDVTIHGQDPSSRLVGVCKMNLLLRDARGVRIEPGNALRAPILDQDRTLVRYDRVITAPPINQAHWGAEDAAHDPFGRFPLVPPKHNADYAYVLHTLAVLDDGGRAVVLTDRGVLFRLGGEERIRRMLVERDCFEAIIGLPGGLLYGTHIPATLLVLRKGKNARSGRVLFAELRQSRERKSRSEALRTDDMEMVRDVVLGFRGHGDLSAVVDLQRIVENQWSLSPALYLPRRTTVTSIDPVDAIESIHALEAERDDAASQVDVLVQELAARLNL